MISYEIIIGVIMIGVMLIGESVSIGSIVEIQRGI